MSHPTYSLLAHDELLALSYDGTITHVEPDQINGTSIDVTLAPVILVERGTSHSSREVVLRDRDPLDMIEVTIPRDGYVLQPNEFILASTEQIFNLPLHLSAEYKLKSSMARIGLEHMNAGWCDPGWHGSALTLELKNESRFHAIRLHPGDRIGQIVFFRNAPVPADRSYAQRGRYNRDARVSGAKRDPQQEAPCSSR